MSNLKAMGEGRGNEKCMFKANPPTLDNFDAANAATWWEKFPSLEQRMCGPELKTWFSTHSRPQSYSA